MSSSILNKQYVNTPYGQMTVIASPKGVAVIRFPNPKESGQTNIHIEKYFSGYEVVESRSPVIEKTLQWLNRFFAGDFDSLETPPLDLRGTAFQLKVWDTLLRIPMGETWSYLRLAEEMGDPKAVRAVGGANGRNPVPIIVPCHRVIGKNGSLVGFGGGIDLKKKLLSHEQSVTFKLSS